jgi:chemotaxis protein CheD
VTSPPSSPLPRPFLTPGTLYCSAEPAVVTTVLGSCVAVCLLDRHRRGAGMNHFVLPHRTSAEGGLRYGDVALDRLGERMLRLGCGIGDLRAKVFGGAAVLPFGEAGDTVGDRNVAVALDWLRGHGIPILARRTGGQTGLLVRFHTGSGRVLVRAVTPSAGVALDDTVPVHDSRHPLGGARE